MINLRYLVVGTGRCGTVFLARLLTSLNIPCGHETFFDHSGIDTAIERLKNPKQISLSLVSTRDFSEGVEKLIENWVDTDKLVADSSYLAAPFLDHTILQNTKIIHVVRNPINVINSFIKSFNYFYDSKPHNLYENFIYQQLPELTEEMSQYERASLYYIKWNEMIEKKIGDQSIFYRIEDNLENLLDFLEKSFVSKDKLFNNTKINTFQNKEYKEFTLNDLSNGQIKQKLIAIGRRYGYSMSKYLLL